MCVLCRMWWNNVALIDRLNFWDLKLLLNVRIILNWNKLKKNVVKPILMYDIEV